MSAPTVDLAQVQRRRKHVLLWIVVFVLGGLTVTASLSASGGRVHETVEGVGIVLILLCIAGRTWASLYIGGRKAATLVSRGPYSIVRNPLYAFSVVGAVGAGAQLGSVVAAAAAGLVCWAVFRGVVAREEAALSDTLGEPYRRYVQRVPRFLPDFRIWQDEGELVVQPKLVLRTLADALFFLLALPLAELVELAQTHGWLTVLLRLP